MWKWCYFWFTVKMLYFKLNNIIVIKYLINFSFLQLCNKITKLRPWYRPFFAEPRWKMMLFSTFLAALVFFATTDAEWCYNWNGCYKQKQMREKSSLQRTFEEMANSLSAQHDKIEVLIQDKSNQFFNVFFCWIIYLKVRKLKFVNFQVKFKFFKQRPCQRYALSF